MIALGVLAGQLGEVGEHIANFNAVVIGKDGAKILVIWWGEMPQGVIFAGTGEGLAGMVGPKNWGGIDGICGGGFGA